MQKQTAWRYNTLYILSWYLLSTILSIYNKTLMGKEHYNLNLPLLMSAVHSGIHSIISRILIKHYNHTIKQYSMFDYITKVIPCGIAAAMDISCANASLVLITLSFYTVIKSSTPVWVLLFSFMFGFEKPTLNLIAVISLIVVGVSLTVDGESHYNTHGFILVLVAAIASGLRWNLTQFLMKSNDKQQQQSPLATMYHLSPIMFITMLSLSLYIEKPFQHHQNASSYLDFVFKALISLSIMAVGGILAFMMTLSELYLIKGTSTVTLSVAGISKEILVITLSVFIYGDILTTKTYLG
ncbi:triose-phosphate transporter family-domain-containing protein [Mucor lusitanicus]|uniref:Triose-phosphate transporter family-domain-containing protein n=1 Tax=Mucor circinelloides f. lusitanicus TaxID=29924 RepID=A0A8H4BFI8_MUCCL|nr:triose-phosphate transporter family-domain-containing protein [Mucor lusitanicus]